MSIKLNGKAYGKINLYLDVLDKMENGYHNIESVMQSVSLSDDITVELWNSKTAENTIEIISSSEKIPNDKSNIVYKCIAKYFDYTGIKGKYCVISIDKHIPVSAGMAGGSSDGATALKLINEACGNLLDHSTLCKISSSVGADIPFCLTGGTCVTMGIGDIITPINPLKNVYIVSAIDSSSVSTPIAFSMLDEKYGTKCVSSNDINKIINAIDSGNLPSIASLLYNKFENVIIPTIPSISNIKEIMLNNGALGAIMSGSGPSVFGIFMDEISQKKAYESLKNCSINAFLCKTI